MDITVTTPLEMGMGQQKYVVAYTLKQGVEKQPDILSAQKTQGAASIQSIKDIQKMGSPVGIRPDALCSGPNGGSGGLVAKQSTIYATQSYDQKSTPSSRQSTLKRNDTSNTYSLLQQQQPPHHLQGKPPPVTSATGLPQYTTAAGSYTNCSAGGGDLLDYEKQYGGSGGGGYSTLQYNHNPPPLVDPYSYKSSPADPVAADPLDYDKNLDYRLLNISNEIKNNSTANHIEYRNNNHHSSSNLQLGSSSSRPPQTGSGGPNPEYRYSGSEYASDLMDFSNVPSPSSSTNVGATLTKNRNRQHIITDTLPGPESCV